MSKKNLPVCSIKGCNNDGWAGFRASGVVLCKEHFFDNVEVKEVQTSKEKVQ